MHQFQMNQMFVQGVQAVLHVQRKESVTGVKKPNHATFTHSLASYLITVQQICGTIRNVMFSWLFSSFCFHCWWFCCQWGYSMCVYGTVITGEGHWKCSYLKSQRFLNRKKARKCTLWGEMMKMKSWDQSKYGKSTTFHRKKNHWSPPKLFINVEVVGNTVPFHHVNIAIVYGFGMRSHSHTTDAILSSMQCSNYYKICRARVTYYRASYYPIHFHFSHIFHFSNLQTEQHCLKLALYCQYLER